MAVTTIPPRASRSKPLPETEDIPPRRIDWRVVFVVGMLLMLGLYYAGAVALSWWKSFQDELHYGKARISSLTVDVGHQGVSNFIACQNDGLILVIEITGEKKVFGYQTNIVMYNGPAVVTLEATDYNHDNKLDLLVIVDGIPSGVVLENTGSSFTVKP